MKEKKEAVILYRGIRANSLKDANRYIKSTKSYGEQRFGNGMYLTRNIEMAKSYGNFIYKFKIDPSDIWKEPTPDVTMMRKCKYREYIPELIAKLENTNYYSFSGLISWKKSK